MNRPTGVTVIAILNLLGSVIALFTTGLLAFIVSLPDFGIPYNSTATVNIFGMTDAGFLVAVVMILMLISAVLGIVVSIGMFSGWRWVWYLSIITWIMSITSSIITMTYVGLICIVFIWYFFRKNVKQYFGVK